MSDARRMQWLLTHPRATPEHLGYVPSFFSEDDPRPAREQLDERYAHGGGFRPALGALRLHPGNAGRAYLTYPGDPPFPEIARTTLRDERLIFFDRSYLAIVQADDSHVLCKVD